MLVSAEDSQPTAEHEEFIQDPTALPVRREGGPGGIVFKTNDGHQKTSFLLCLLPDFVLITMFAQNRETF